MKGFADKPNYIIELLEGSVTLEDVIDGHICEQTVVGFSISVLFKLFRVDFVLLKATTFTVDFSFLVCV